jgi:hypothetical protein
MKSKPILPTKPIYSVHILEIDSRGDASVVKRIARDKLKNSRVYGTKIVLDDLLIGKELGLKRLGHWAFGIPGFEGKLKFEKLRNDKLILKIPDDAPECVHDLAYKIKELIHD